MKLLAIVSSLDLRLPYSCTPAWWQLLKALSEIGVDVVATPYAGRAVETPWWRAYENPCLHEGEAVRRGKAVARRMRSTRAPAQSDADLYRRESMSDRAIRLLAQEWTRPKWERHVRKIVERERDVDAILILTVPPNQIRGLARRTTERWGIPVYYYDGDVPASLPQFSGFHSGFRIYEGSDPSEFEAFFSNSMGGGNDLLALGAKQVHTLYYGVDPTMFRPARVDQDLDVFFYGAGVEYRQEWVKAMIAEPSREMPQARFAVRGKGFDEVDLGSAERLPYLSVGKLREDCNRSKLNLVINRQAHASVYASSTSRPFELAAMGCCMVSSPYLGIEEWFEPEKEVVVVAGLGDATERYTWLLAHDTARRQLSEAAHRRVLSEHTYRHRAGLLLKVLRGAVGGGQDAAGVGSQSGKVTACASS